MYVCMCLFMYVCVFMLGCMHVGVCVVLPWQLVVVLLVFLLSSVYCSYTLHVSQQVFCPRERERVKTLTYADCLAEDVKVRLIWCQNKTNDCVSRGFVVLVVHCTLPSYITVCGHEVFWGGRAGRTCKGFLGSADARVSFRPV